MAEFHCRSCGKEGTWVYDPERSTCPMCDSIDVQFVVYRHELPDDGPAARRMDALTAEAKIRANEGRDYSRPRTASIFTRGRHLPAFGR